MIHRNFKKPNYICNVIGDDEEKYEFLTFAGSEKELLDRLKKKNYKVESVKPYAFKKWEKKAKQATKEAIEAHEKGEKYKPKSSIWGTLKLHLFELFDDKCAYCESKLLHVSSGDVEHYRPKKGVSEDPSHPGYYWLSYNVMNLLPACEKCNRVRGKKTHFPVHGNKWAHSPKELPAERPLLLNPYEVKNLEKHLSFPPGKKGIYVGKANAISDEGEKSIKIYNLNRSPLTEKRREIQEKTEMELRLAVASDNMIKWKGMWDELKKGKRECSAAALSQAKNWLQRLHIDDMP